MSIIYMLAGSRGSFLDPNLVTKYLQVRVSTEILVHHMDSFVNLVLKLMNIIFLQCNIFSPTFQNKVLIDRRWYFVFTFVNIRGGIKKF